MAIRLKRAYDPPARSDGMRVLVDRVWPRGVSKEEAQIDLWAKEIAPSTELRKWFGHDPEKWDEFQRRYAKELKQGPEKLEPIVEKARAGRVTLVYGTREAEHNNAVALKSYLREACGVE